jgi:hypothetical protein
MAAKGEAMDDGSYPIKNRADLDNAIHAVGRGSAPHADIVAHIRKRAKALHATATLPDTWSVADFYDPEDLGDFASTLADVEARARAYAFWGALAERMDREDGLEAIGTWGADLHGVGLAKPSAARLTEHWTHGKGAAKIRWGTPGSMTRCIRHLTGKVRSPGGLCADYHKIATGEWPTEHGRAGIPS